METEVLESTEKVVGQLETMRGTGYFRKPRSVSEVWCRLKDDGRPVDLVSLGFALSDLWQKEELFRTVLKDGLLRYVDKAEASTWRPVDTAAIRGIHRQTHPGPRVIH